MKQAGYDLCFLAACAVNGLIPDREKVAAMDLEKLYTVSRMHSLTALCAVALMSAGVELPAQWQGRKDMAVRRSILFTAERGKILRALEERGIWYLPLKGAILAEMYPQPGMREMADNDILYDKTRQKDVEEIMVALGYDAECVGVGHHDVFKKKPIYNFEMHTGMFREGQNALFTAYYENIESRLIPDSNTSFGRHMRDEDFYIHITAHEHKHYINYGTGLRSLLDRYVYLLKKRDVLDFDYIRAECAKLGIADFEQESRSLCEKVLAGPALPELAPSEQQMLEAYLFSATYGTMEKGVRRKMEKAYGKISAGVKLRYILRRIFPKPQSYMGYCPLAQKYRILIPYAWCKRLVILLVKGRNRIRNEISTVRDMD